MTPLQVLLCFVGFLLVMGLPFFSRRDYRLILVLLAGAGLAVGLATVFSAIDGAGAGERSAVALLVALRAVGIVTGWLSRWGVLLVLGGLLVLAGVLKYLHRRAMRDTE